MRVTATVFVASSAERPYRCTGRLVAASQNDPPYFCSFKPAYCAKFTNFVFESRPNPPYFFDFNTNSVCAPPPTPPKNPSPNASIFGGFLLFSRRDSLGERGGRKPDSQRNQRIRAGKGGMDSRNWRFLPNRLVSMSKKRGGHFETRPLKWSGKSVVLRAWKRRKKFDFKKTGG